MGEVESANIPPLMWCEDIDLATRIHLIQPKIRLKFGYFLDSPFPPYSAFSDDSFQCVLPLINLLLKNDGLAFRTRESAMNFITLCKEALDLEISRSGMYVRRGKKYTRLCSLPLSLPFSRYQRVLRSYFPMMEMPPFETCIMLRIDFLALNCTLGMQRRMKAFKDSIEYEPSLRGMVVFLQIFLLEGDGSMALGEDLLAEKTKIETIVSEVNDMFVNSPWKPLIVMYGLQSQPELEPFFEDMRYINSYGIDQFSVEKEFLLFETDSEPRRLVFVPYFGCNAQMREANLVKENIPQLRDVLMRRLYDSDDRKIETLRSFQLKPVSYMKEYLMKQMLFIADAVVAAEFMALHPTTFEYLDSTLKKVVEHLQHLTIVMDYDGALLDMPKGSLHKPCMNPILKEAIERMSQNPQVTIMIIGVMGVEELAAEVGIPNLTYIGNHGYQIIFKDGSSWNMTMNRDLLNQRMEMANEMHRKACVDGARVTDHGLTVLFEAKEAADPLRKSLTRMARELAEEYGLEARPWRGGLLVSCREVTKAGGLERALQEYSGDRWPLATSVLYLGDDLQDEQAVKCLQLKGNVYFIRVMKGFHPKTDAIAKLVRSNCILTLLDWLEKTFI